MKFGCALAAIAWLVCVGCATVSELHAETMPQETENQGSIVEQSLTPTTGGDSGIPIPTPAPRETPDFQATPEITPETVAESDRTLYACADGTLLTIDVQSNVAADAFVQLLAFSDISVGLRENDTFERIGRLGHELPHNDQMTSAQPGDIVLYDGDLIAVILDAVNGRLLTRIGRIDANDEELQGIFGDDDTIMRFSLNDKVCEAAASDSNIHDTPDLEGQWNVIRRARQITQLQYAPLQTIRLNGSWVLESGEPVSGIPYSSVREEALYVPQCVSIESFMTALQNPNSYLYTKQSKTPNSRAYYGAVCSSFAAWCYGIEEVVPTTISFAAYPGIEKVPTEQQNVQSLRLADMLINKGSHIVVVTDIIRDFDGRITTIEISQARSPRCSSSILSAQAVESKYLQNDYLVYRYQDIENVTYTASPWICLFGETEEPPERPVLIPRRGNKANWRSTEPVEIDVLQTGDNTEYLLYDETGALLQSGTVPEDHLLTFENLPRGTYSVLLRNGESCGTPAVFAVMDVNPTYTVQSDGTVRVDFPKSEGEAASICFACNNKKSTRYMGIYAFHVLTEEEKERQYAVIEAPDRNGSWSVGNAWLMKVMYKTEFGLYSSDLTPVSFPAD